jgi:hypothetical protein
MMGVAQGLEEFGFLDAMPDVLRTGRVPASFAHGESDIGLPGVQQFLASGGVVYVVPVVNPDGRRPARTRTRRASISIAIGPRRVSQRPSRWSDSSKTKSERTRQICGWSSTIILGFPDSLYPRADSRVPIPFTDLTEHLVHHELMPRSIRKSPTSLFDSIRDIYAEQPVYEVLNDCVVTPRCYTSEWDFDCLHTEEVARWALRVGAA